MLVGTQKRQDQKAADGTLGQQHIALLIPGLRKITAFLLVIHGEFTNTQGSL